MYIKPCPFCGGEAKDLIFDIHSLTKSNGKKYRCSIVCLRCGASVETDEFDTEDDAAKSGFELWNRRIYDER